ncbi:TPA: Wadjet anti-phage system protein JetD domain-containing protein [Pseudomonas aeruginosa]
MDTIAKELLQKLLVVGNKADAGVRQRAPSLTRSQLKPYLALRNWHQKQKCEETFLSARDAGAISIVRDKFNPVDGLIERIDLLDTQALAQFLGRFTHADFMADARAFLEPHFKSYEVLGEVLDKWARLGRVRGQGPASVADWVDSIRVIGACNQHTESTSVPIREFSARLFRDSKRVEKLTAPLDVLLMGSLECTPRPSAEVWQEIGLFREEQPVLLAGNVNIVRSRVTAILDDPYSGLPASAIQAVSGPLDAVLSIENLTTFHSEAKRGSSKATLLVYTGGMPSPAWRAMYSRLLSSIPSSVPVYHWGDVDEGGFRIAAALAATAADANHRLLAYAMDPADVPLDMRKPASERVLARMQHYAERAGWAALGAAIAAAKFTVEQEAL